MFTWALFVSGAAALATMQPIVPGGDLRAVDGSTIEAHEGGIIQVGGTYYLYGTDRAQDNGWFVGINLYSSTDLVHWAFVRQILNYNSHSALQNHRVERPKILRHPATGQFVMWFHYESDGYSLAEVGYADCSTIDGDFIFRDHFRPNGRESRDLGAFQDTDGNAYLLCSTDGNSSATIFRLNGNYSGIETEVFHGGGSVNGEGHAMLKVANTYFWFMSGYSGWAANDNYYYTASSLSGPWTYRGSFVPSGSKTYFSQIYNATAIQGNSSTTYMFMGDRWNPSAFSKSRLVWLPLQINGVSAWAWWADTWFVDTWTGYWGYGAQNIPDGNYKMIARHSNKAIHATGTSDGSWVDQFAYSANSNQQWSVSWLNNNGAYRFTGVESGRVLEVSGQATWDGARVDIYGNNGGNNQKWMIAPTDRGYYSVMALHSGKVLEVAGSATTNGTPVQQWSRIGGNNQEWAFVPVDGNTNKPPAPASLKAFIPNGLIGKVRLDWTPVNGAMVYRIKRATTNTGPFSFIGVSTVPSFTLGPAPDTYYYTVSATNWFGEGSNSTPVRFASTGLRARYEFEGNVADSSNNAYDGENSGAAFTPGRSGSLAAQFSGTNCITVPCCIGENDFSIAFWLRTTNTAGTGEWWAGHGLVDGEMNGAAADFGVSLVGSRVGFGVGNHDTTLLSFSLVNDGNWHHVAATWSRASGDMQIYIDGVLEDTVTGPNGARTAPASLRLGSIRTGTSGGFFKGSLDDVRLYEYIVSASEVTSLLDANTAPTLAAISNQTLIAGAVLTLTNAATDPQTPPQTLTYGLLDAPSGATLNTNSGVIFWRPTIAQSGSTNLITLRVADDGSPSLSATQSFWTMVVPPAQPVISQATISNGFFQFIISGDASPDYTVLRSSNLVDWVAVWTTNSPALPYLFADPLQTTPENRFYRVLLGP